MRQHKSTRAAVEATLKGLDLEPSDAAEVALARELAAQVDAAKADAGADSTTVLQQVRLAAGRLDKVLHGLRRRVQDRQRARGLDVPETPRDELTDEDARVELVFAELEERAARRRGESVPVDESPARVAVRAEMEADHARMVAEHGGRAAAPVLDEELDDDEG